MFSAQVKTLLSAPRYLGLVRHDLFRNLASKSGDVKYVPNLERCLNKVTLIGRVGNNPEQRGTTDNPVVLFSMATNTTYFKEENNEEIIQDTQWHRIATFIPSLRNKVLRTVKKGVRVFISGKITYFTKSSEQNPSVSSNYATIIAEDLIILSKIGNDSTKEATES